MINKEKILIVTPTMNVVGGRERVISNFCVNLIDRLDINILTLSGDVNSHFPLPDSVVVETIFTYFFSQKIENKKFYNNAGYFSDILKLRVFLRSKKEVGTIISTDAYCSIMLYFAQLGLPKKRFIANEHLIFDSNYNAVVKKIRNFIYPHLFDEVVTLTEQDKSKYQAIGCKNVVVIPNALTYDVPMIKPKTNNKTMLAIGRLSSEKGFDMLIEACKNVFSKNQDWKLKIFGTGSLKETLQKQIVELGLSENIFLLPPTTSVLSTLQNADIYILSSRNEAYPMVLTEALSVGLACVSYNCPCGPKEIISDGIDGVLVEPNNIEQLTEKINLLISDESLRQKLGKNAFLNIKRLEPKVIFDKWHSLISNKLCFII